MYSDVQLAAFADLIAENMAIANTKILMKLGSQLKDIEKLTPTQAHQLQQMYTFGADKDEISKILSAASGKSIQEVKALYSTVAAQEYKWYKPFYNSRGISQLPLAQNSVLRSFISSAATLTGGTLANLSRTTVLGILKAGKTFIPLDIAYPKAIDRALVSVATGMEPVDKVLYDIIQDFGGSGLRVQYEKGGTRRIDTAVRQSVLGGLHDINQGIADQVGKEFGADGVEISAHAVCAPDHIDIQGQQYSLAQFEDLQNNLERAIGEHNCRHYAFPIVLGVSEPSLSMEQLNSYKEASERKVEYQGKEYTRYEASQVQRKLETGVRYAKDELRMATSAGNSNAINDANKKVNTLRREYSNFSKAVDLPKKTERYRTI